MIMYKIVYVIVINTPNSKYTCGVISNLSKEVRNRLVDHIYDQTGLEFNGLCSLNFSIDLCSKLKADNDEWSYLSIEREVCFE